MCLEGAFSMSDVIDIYFWHMPFASVRHCIYVLDIIAKIPEDEWMTKRAAIAAEHDQEGALEELRQGLKNWIVISRWSTAPKR
jgi:hypothetical protein